MKKIITGILTVVGVMLMSTAAFAQISVYVDSEPLKTDNEPIIENDYTLVPMRAVFEALGAEVRWAAEERAVVAYKGTSVIQMIIDSKTLYINGTELELDVPARIINDRTYVPLRAVSENLNAQVEWNGENRTVSITTNKTEHKITQKDIRKEIKSDDGTALISMIFTYPQIDNPQNDEKINAFNYESQSRAEERLKSTEELYTELAQQAYDDAGNEGEDFEELFIYSGYDISYDYFGRISLAEQGVLSEGAYAQPDYFGTYNYDLNSAKELLISDVLNITDKDFEQIQMYSFYLYENNIILCLNSDNMIYANYGYEPSMVLAFSDETQQCFKFNPASGEALEWDEPVVLFEIDTAVPENESDIEGNDILQCNSAEELEYRVGFRPALLSDEGMYTPVSYALVGGECTEVSYTDENGKSVIVRKAEGDFANIPENDGDMLFEKVLNDSMVEIYEKDNCCYALFTVEKADGKLYSYSVVMESKNLSALNNICVDITKKEAILK